MAKSPYTPFGISSLQPPLPHSLSLSLYIEIHNVRCIPIKLAVFNTRDARIAGRMGLILLSSQPHEYSIPRVKFLHLPGKKKTDRKRDYCCWRGFQYIYIRAAQRLILSSPSTLLVYIFNIFFFVNPFLFPASLSLFDLSSTISERPADGGVYRSSEVGAPHSRRIIIR